MEIKQRYRATNLEDILCSQGRTKAWLGRQIGVHRSFVVHLAKGRKTADEAMAKQIAGLLGMPLFLLFELSEDALVTPSELSMEAIPA
jgi:hypothetical protein